MKPAMTYVALVGAGLLLGATGVAVASDSGPNSSPSASTESDHDDAEHADDAEGRGHGRGHGKGPGRGRGMGKHFIARGALHGEFVVRAPDGNFLTMVVQRGEVTAVSATSLRLKSADGFTRTYAVTSDTSVKARAGGITSIEKGSQASVIALKSGGDLKAQMVNDKKGPKFGDDESRPESSPTASGAAT